MKLEITNNIILLQKGNEANKLIVGYMRNFSEPRHIAEVTAMLCKFMGIDFLYMNANDVDMENHKVFGRMLVNDKWVRVEEDIPSVIDLSPFCYKHKKVISYLRERSFLTDNLKHKLSKSKLQTVLENDRDLSKYSIPTRRLNSFGDLLSSIREHKEDVVKPVYSRHGRGVYIISKRRRKFIVGIQKREKVLSKRRFKKLYKNEMTAKLHVVQKSIISKTKTGDPFDCRVHLEKNGEGEWIIIKIIARIGIGQKVIANVNYGGGRSEIIPFLKANYPANWENIHAELKALGLSLARKIEEVRKTELMTLGLDVGIDRKGNLFVFEANSAPGTEIIKSEVALTRAGYYRFLLEKYSAVNS